MMGNYIRQCRLSRRLSERALANSAGISRPTLRNIETGQGNFTVHSMERVCQALDIEFFPFFITPNVLFDPASSTCAIAYQILQQGFDSWPLHMMELVDDFRKTKDIRLVLLPPPKPLDARLRSLLASIVFQLCQELELPIPDWASRTYFLNRPWFISETESLKATAIFESPLAFRRNNIFVLSNFLNRA